MKFFLVFTLFLVLVGAMMTSAKSCICLQVHDPVCGVNGKTYGNFCKMACDGVKLRHKGECKKKN